MQNQTNSSESRFMSYIELYANTQSEFLRNQSANTKALNDSAVYLKEQLAANAMHEEWMLNYLASRTITKKENENAQ